MGHVGARARLANKKGNTLFSIGTSPLATSVFVIFVYYEYRLWPTLYSQSQSLELKERDIPCPYLSQRMRTYFRPSRHCLTIPWSPSTWRRNFLYRSLTTSSCPFLCRSCLA